LKTRAARRPRAAARDGLDILVNNAAFQMTHSSILEMPPEEIDVTGMVYGATGGPLLP
jgi:NAD(P)-dependent dehydrogenase (short-subunit alcohol dehydrogenase family)